MLSNHKPWRLHHEQVFPGQLAGCLSCCTYKDIGSLVQILVVHKYLHLFPVFCLTHLSNPGLSQISNQSNQEDLQKP